jgi:choline dehydrogenase
MLADNDIIEQTILCGGAVNSPQLLMLSGIGPADELRQHGISLVHHSPGVGSNLQDHLEVYVQHRSTKPVTLYRYQVKTLRPPTLMY